VAHQDLERRRPPSLEDDDDPIPTKALVEGGKMRIRRRDGGMICVLEVELHAAWALVGDDPEDCLNVGDERLFEVTEATAAEWRGSSVRGFRVRDARRNETVVSMAEWRVRARAGSSST
jgi:hypothetical protein